MMFLILIFVLAFAVVTFAVGQLELPHGLSLFTYFAFLLLFAFVFAILYKL